MSGQKVLILSGLPGAGKTHFAQAQSLTWASGVGRVTVVSADDYFQARAYDRKLLDKAHRMCFWNFMAALRTAVPLVIVDNTNLTAAEIAPYYLAGETWGYDVTVLRVQCPPVEAYARKTHDVSEMTFARMCAQWGSRDVLDRWKVEEV